MTLEEQGNWRLRSWRKDCATVFTILISFEILHRTFWFMTNSNKTEYELLKVNVFMLTLEIWNLDLVSINIAADVQFVTWWNLEKPEISITNLKPNA